MINKFHFFKLDYLKSWFNLMTASMFGLENRHVSGGRSKS